MSVARIEDVSEFVLDGTHASPVRTETGVPVLSAQNVKDGILSFKTDRYTSEEEYRSFKSRLALQEGDLLLTIVGTIGRSAVVRTVRPLVFQRSVAIIRPKAAVVDPRFFFHASCSQSFQAQLASSANQSSQAGVYLGKLKKVKIPLPPLAEQRRIAEVLDRAEGLRAKRRAALAQLDTLTQSMFLDLFGDTAANSKGWPSRALQDECDQINDCPHSTPAWTEEGVICLRTSNLTEGGWDWSDTRYVSEKTYNERSKRGHVEPGDIVLSREGTVGIAAIVTPGMRVCMGQRLVQLRPASSVLLPDFLLRHLLYVLSPARIGQVMVGSTSQHLNVKELKALRLPLPPLALQRDFASRIAIVDKLKAVHRTSLAEMEGMFAALQFRAFRGRL